MFEESVCGYKDNWYGVFPKGEEGLRTIVSRSPKVDANGHPVLRPNGTPIIVERSRFPFKWVKNHYLLPASSFSRAQKEMDPAILADYKVLCDFVDGFVPVVRTDKEGNPVVDEQGNVITSKRFIDTKALLACSTRVEAESLLSMSCCNFISCSLCNIVLSFVVLLSCFVFVSCADMMSNQEKFKRMQEVTRARKARDAGNALISSSSGPTSSSVPPTPPAGSSLAPTPTPSATNSAVASPHRDAVSEKRGTSSPEEDVRPEKNARIDGSSNQLEGLHRLQPGVPARRFVLPAVFAHGGNVFDESTKVIIPEADQAIMTDMGPESLKNVITESSMHSMKLMEIVNFLNTRERHFVDERSKLEKRMKGLEKSHKKMDAELKKARQDYEELGANYDAYKDKYQLQRRRRSSAWLKRRRICWRRSLGLMSSSKSWPFLTRRRRKKILTGSLPTLLADP
jgi:hypothetical protein